MIKHLFYIISFILIFPLHAQSTLNKLRASETISDSININHIDISLNITDYAGQTIFGFAEYQLTSLVDNINEIPFDLIGLTVDSVELADGTNISFTQSEVSVLISLADDLDEGEEIFLRIFYGGSPVQDATWGGWYWSGDYSYQLGVGFDAVPHNFGRVWFPCFDNFIERQTFTFSITTTTDKKAVCGGLLESETDNGDGTITWKWNLAQEIPSYLASCAVSNYEFVSSEFEGLEDTVPVLLAAKAEDTLDLKNSFVHLQNAFNTFEKNYGAYAWDRVGFAVVPFSGGAMEHATNIAYPLFAVTGTTAWENTMAHELSHHWWGNLVTCRSAEEMWLNEGWASYSEYLFLQELYGDSTYNEIVKFNHTYVLHYSAAVDGNNYFALSAMPPEYTYGNTTYIKGADVVHTLRGFMGDDAFFSCIKEFLQEYKFQDVSSQDLNDFLNDCSGINLDGFFNGWIYQPGYPAWEIEDIGYSDFSTISSICIEQKLNHGISFAENVPLTVSLFDKDWNNYFTDTLLINSEHFSYILPLFIELPQAIILDYQEKINDAVTADEFHITETGTYTSDNAFLTFTVDSISEPAVIYAEQYWVAADNFKSPVHGLHINTQRYWKIQGTFPETFHASAKLTFNGKLSTSGGYLDNEFITNDDDSLVLLYRESTNEEWEIFSEYELNTYGSNTDKFGAFELTSLYAGEYAIGMYNTSIADAPTDDFVQCYDDSQIHESQNNTMKLFPNPANTYCTIEFSQAIEPYFIFIYDSTGEELFSEKVRGRKTISISVKNLPSGTYEIKSTSVDNSLLSSQKLMIIH